MNIGVKQRWRLSMGIVWVTFAIIFLFGFALGIFFRATLGKKRREQKQQEWNEERRKWKEEKQEHEEQNRRKWVEERRKWEEQHQRKIEIEKQNWEEEAQKKREEVEKHRINSIKEERAKAEDLRIRDAIFIITTASEINGYHVKKEWGWVKCKCNERSSAERLLRSIALEKYKSINALIKLSNNETRKIKTWEAMAVEAISNQSVDKSPIRWNSRVAVVDGSNVAYWGDKHNPSLKDVKAITHLLKKEGVDPILVFDANIGYTVENKYLDAGELEEHLGADVRVEIVQAGTVADRRIVELAEQHKAIIVSNDLFRDSLRARPIPKRRGFYLREYDHAELLKPRP